PVTAGEGTTFGDFLESPNPGPEAELIEKSLTESIDSILNRLPERERNVIIMRYGLHNNEPMSLKEVGELYGVTKERIRQIEKKVLATLREDSTVKQLQTYIA
ncbi:MAG: sigma-70 family RNA polymerase sigma factor, partial [Spirochaetales bacterium]